MKDIELPPLPEPDHFAFIDGGHGIYVEGGPTGEPFYSAEQMSAYARAAVEADRAQRVPDVEDLKDRLVAISSAVADSDDREAQAIIRTTLELLASTPAPAQQEPPQQERKPMTEQEGLALATSLGWKIDFGGIGKDALELIAAVERHHGIKE